MLFSIRVFVSFFSILFSTISFSLTNNIACHRAGCNSEFPNNTKEAMADTLNAGFRSIEIDLRISRDEHFIVSHDNSLNVQTSNCRGQITTSDLSMVQRCIKVRNSYIPEVYAQNSNQFAYMTSLQSLINSQLLTDPRLHYLILDLKPDTMVRMLATFIKEIVPLSIEIKSKLIFIYRDVYALRSMKVLNPYSKYALESNLGFGPLITPTDYIGNGVGISVKIPQISLYADQMNELTTGAHNNDQLLIGWTVNNREKVYEYIYQTGKFDFILTDLSIARLEE